MIKRHIIKLTIFIIPVVTAITLIAGPTIIRDNRVTDLGSTPFLGRGYSIATNTYQSSCMKQVQLTEPSYDLHYLFTEGTKEKQTTIEHKTDTKASYSSTYRGRTSMSILGMSGSGSVGQDFSISTSVQTSVFDDKQYFNHDVFVTIDLYSYYASVDEAKSRLSDSAVKLLNAKDIPGFFSSCGPYYVRSIGRVARFVSKFTYSTVTQQRDYSFQQELNTRIKGFASGSASFNGWLASGSASASTTYEKTLDFKQEFRFSQKSREMRLRIESHGFGLGKNREATLIAYDLTTFKQAIKDAFLSMQNARTGKVTSIEVVPWVENTEFQALVELEKSPDVYVDVKDKDGNPVVDEKGNTKKVLKEKGRPLYEKKMILTLNAEFLMELERADRNLLNIFYKAKLCRKMIDANWKQQRLGSGDVMTGSSRRLLSEFQDRWVRCNRPKGDPIKLVDLDKRLTPGYINGLLEQEKKFMYGTASGAEEEKTEQDKGANACIRMIMNKGITKYRYTEHKSCQDLVEQLSALQDQFVEDYCMPNLTDYIPPEEKK